MPRNAALNIFAALAFVPCALAFLNIKDERTRYSVVVSAAVSALGFLGTVALIPLVRRRTLRAGLSGKDINKRGSSAGDKDIPEALGLAPGVVFLVCIILFQQLHYYDVTSFIHSLSNGGGLSVAAQRVSDAWLVDYNAALATICFMLFLGFADDVLDIPWRVKLVLPALASLPLLTAYSGGTGVLVPRPLRVLLSLPRYLELGVLYKGYMVALVIFCTNAINILAGINGLEAGQTAVIGAAVLFHNLVMLGSPAGAVPAIRDGHLFSAYLMLPLVATTLGLLRFNWFPAQVFVGDTFTYFAGMTLAVAGILGHFSETLLLFFMPQVFNFVYSVPQLFKWVPCPRHRLPRYDPATGLLHATPNMNLVNLMLRLLGPCTERALCVRLLTLQALSCVAGFAARHWLAPFWR